MVRETIRFETQVAARSAKRVGFESAAMLIVLLLCLVATVLLLVGLALGLASEIGLGGGFAVSGGVGFLIAAVAWPVSRRVIDRQFGGSA